MTDATVIHEYTLSRSPRLLDELVTRHADWVYSAALRMVADADLAQDVTQAVFLVFFQKAAYLDGKPLNAWLFGVTRFAAKNTLRAKARRNRHERMAAIMLGQPAAKQDNQIWAAIAPLLDDLVERLNQGDRRAILLRFYQAKSMAEVGEALGVSEDAAKKRVAKAVKQLREMLNGHGIKVPADALGIAMLQHATQSAPPILSDICKKSAAGTTGAMSIANGVIRMMALTRIKIAALAVASVTLLPAAISLAILAADSPATNPSPAPLVAAIDATDLYAAAAKSLTVDSPAATANVYPEFSPSSAEWRASEALAWAADAKARQLVRQARAAKSINTPAISVSPYLNNLRNLANHMGDSAVYANSQANDAQAAEIILDLKHISDLMEFSPKPTMVDLLVGCGINQLAMNRLEIIASGVVLTNDPKNKGDLQISTANAVIAQLISQPNRADQSLVEKGSPSATTQWLGIQANRSKLIETLNRCHAEQILAAMSLACHVFQFEKGRWPNSLKELIPAYLPAATIDPWGDGKQTLGYLLVKGGLPDGSDRPLVFSRCYSNDGLFYKTNELALNFYNNDGTSRPFYESKHGGQFRDVARWEPRPNFTGPTTQPLPPEAVTTIDQFPPAATSAKGNSGGTE